MRTERKRIHRGSDFRDLLNEQGNLGEVEARALNVALSHNQCRQNPNPRVDPQPRDPNT
jgi:hypothetical protein